MFGRCDILLVYSPDAEEWCQYLQDLFLSSRQIRGQKTLTYRLGPDTFFSAEDLTFFLSTRCIVVLLSAELAQHFGQRALLPLLQRAFHPPQRMVRLLCGVQNCKEFLDFFPEWAHWQELTCDDEPETYLAAVKRAISEGKDLSPLRYRWGGALSQLGYCSGHKKDCTFSSWSGCVQRQ